MIVLLIEALFALVFLRALLAYVRHRDPLQRDVTLVFTATAVLFVLEVWRHLVGPPPRPVLIAGTVLLLAQPYLTLRLVERVRPVPRWAMWGAFATFAATTVPLVARGQRAPVALVLTALAAFIVVEAAAGVLLALEARRRAGSPRTRLILAAAGTGLFAAALLAAGAGTVSPHAAATARGWANGIALVSALGYVAAFLPPAFLRRLWIGAAAYTVSQHLTSAPVTAPPEATWRRYATTVREVTGADAAVIVLPGSAGGVEIVAAAGLADPGEVNARLRDLERLLVAPQPVALGPDPAADPPLLALARRADARLVTAVPLRLPLGGRGALLVLTRRRSLFAEDDMRLLGELGTQAALLAERAAVRAEQERLATELAASVRAHSAASQAKSDFLASMSHELRTPLNAIIGFSELMRGEPADGDRRSVPVDWVEHVYTSGRHLLGLINDILDLAKIEAGRMELRHERVDLPELVGEVVTTLRPLIETKRLKLTTVVPPVVVHADRTRLRQVLDNLLSNAIKFTPDEGSIFVGASDSASDAQITVADTGPGIAPEDQQRVFEEFQQVGDPIMHQAGTGLGLALTRRLVQAHGGRIELHSELGQGARFTVHLPVRAPSGTASPAPADPAGRAEVLLIEDEPSAARLVATYLQAAGYAVHTASTGEEGIEAACRHRPDAVLLDVLLPGIDGWEVLRRLKRDPHLRDVPVFMVTIVDERDIGLALGAAQYFVKPVDRHLLLASLAEQLVPEGHRDDETRILAIDDDPDTLDTIGESLRRQGFQVVTTTSGQEGLRLARSGRFDLIISDLVMTDIDGFTLISALDNDPVTRRVPVLVLTAHDLTEADKADLNGKVLGILPKGRAVHDALRDWLARHTPAALTAKERAG